METIKNVVVVIVIGLVGYGVYAAVSNKPAAPPPPEALTDWATPDSGDMQGFVEMGELEEGGSQGSSTTSLEMPSSLEVPSFGNELPGDAPGSDEALPQTNSPAPSGHNDDHHMHAADAATDAASEAYERYAAGEMGGFDQNNNEPYPSTPTPSSPRVGGAIPPGSQLTGAQVAGGADDQFLPAMAQVNELLAQGRLADAMTHLSAWYGDSRLSDTQQKEVVSLLDQLAGTVIFSRENLLEPAYEVQENDRLEEIGKRYNVPWQLLAKINGIHDAGSIQVGEKIKVVRGPFAALADLQRRELTVMVDGRYAGRFSLDVTNAEKFQGERLVVARKWSAAPESESLHNQGERWLELSDGVTLRGPRTDIDVSAGPEVNPVLRLALRDFDDVFDILSEGSQVMIRR